MQYSRFNIFSKIKNSDNYFIVNLLSGNADIVNPSVASEIMELQKGGIKETAHYSEFIDKGYLSDPRAENTTYRNKYFEFLESRAKDEIQLFFVPNYSCNFLCTYCYQDEYITPGDEIHSGVIDAFFHYIQKEFEGRKKYITVFGGEPLLNSPKQKEVIAEIIRKSNEAGLQLCFVTNGYTLADYIDLLKTASIREVQVTLDGTENVHDSRRFLKGGKGTFAAIVKGIDACLENGITVNLRIVADKENIDNLPELAKFAIDKGWTKSPYFKTQIGRNYELHHCHATPENLFTRISLYEKLYEISKQYPHFLEFYKPAYSVSRFLFENGELPNPLFDSCPACKTEWAFDYTGNIYSCTATVGKTDETLGTFYPKIVQKHAVIEQWQSRDVTEIKECMECNLQLACGGGCGSVSKNNTGSICAPDCRPVKELLELGFAAYFEKENV